MRFLVRRPGISPGEPHLFEGQLMAKVSKFMARSKAAPRLDTPTDLPEEAVTAVSEVLNALLADTYALFIKTKNFHWHVSGPHFRSYHLLFDDQATQIFETTDELAERVRKIGGATIRSIAQIERLKRIEENEQDFVSPADMLRELMEDNKTMMTRLREAHKIAEEHDDIGTASMLEVFIDGAEKRYWFLFEASRGADDTGH
jgi:starvation-inducible DNA-binding protein